MTTDRSDPLYRTLARTLVLAAGLAALLLVLYRIAPVLLAGLLALILAIALNAPVRWLEREKGIPRPAGTVLTFLGLLGAGSLVGWLIVPRLVDEVPRLIDQVPELVESAEERITAIFGDHPEVERQMARAADYTLTLAEGVWSQVGIALGAAVIGVFVVALALYMVVNFPDLLRWHIRSLPPRFRDPATRAFARSSRMVLGWLLASVILGTIKGIAAATFLLLMQIPGAVLWSVIAFFGAFIPRVGFYIMAVPPVLVAFGVSPMTALWTLLFYVVFSELLGNFVAPQIYAETMRLSAVFVLFMTVAMGYAFGVIGVLIAAPVAGFLKAYYDEFYLTRQPGDTDMERRVRVMMERRVEGDDTDER